MSINNKAFLAHLLSFVSANKQAIFQEVITNRTNHFTVVLEDIFQPHNASAILRSCDVFGVQNVHIIENKNEYNINPKVVMGASKWLNIHHHNEKQNNTQDCINQLRKDGYKIYATSPHAKSYLIENVPIEEKFALFFGTEKDGLSDLVLEQADEHVKIPMFGFTESLNISVSGAISMYEISKRLHSSTINWQLTDDEKTALLIEWAKKVVKTSDKIETDFYANL
ncbi:MAG TPA: RNA methyltransferase [Vicingaceae bacterium]|jgi:tRNA (guanosine-2'-O-)-methyltransferase|nr:RNA methyltransferase [Vicingaceae bacterium]